MFKITVTKQDINVKECISSTFDELPNKSQCLDLGIGLGSTCLILDTSDVVILDDGYVWTKI